jgi:hypothetical protein
MDKTTKKSEESSAAQDSCLMKSSEKRETSISTRENTIRLLITMKELFPYLSGSNILKKTTPKNPFLESLLNNLLSPAKIFHSTRNPRSTLTLRILMKRLAKIFSKKMNNLKK